MDNGWTREEGVRKIGSIVYGVLVVWYAFFVMDSSLCSFSCM